MSAGHTPVVRVQLTCVHFAVATRCVARLGLAIDRKRDQQIVDRRRLLLALGRHHAVDQPADVDVDRIDHARGGVRRAVRRRDDVGGASAALQHHAAVGRVAGVDRELVVVVPLPDPLFDLGHSLVLALALAKQRAFRLGHVSGAEKRKN